MPQQEHAFLVQWAVAWPPAGTDRFGEVRRGQPYEVRCAWDRRRRQTVGPTGAPRATDGKLIAATRLPQDTLVALGLRLADLAGTGLGDPPDPGTEVFLVDAAEETTDLKGRVTAYDHTLVAYRGGLPGEGDED